MVRKISNLDLKKTNHKFLINGLDYKIGHLSTK